MSRNEKAQAFDLSTGRADTIEERNKREAEALGLIDARYILRKGRTIPVMVKTTPVMKKLHQELMLKTGKNMTDVYEMALEALARELDARERGES